jgi:hypothetical protein
MSGSRERENSRRHTSDLKEDPLELSGPIEVEVGSPLPTQSLNALEGGRIIMQQDESVSDRLCVGRREEQLWMLEHIWNTAYTASHNSRTDVKCLQYNIWVAVKE